VSIEDGRTRQGEATATPPPSSADETQSPTWLRRPRPRHHRPSPEEDLGPLQPLAAAALPLHAAAAAPVAAAAAAAAAAE
jgi:hypothetical protein